MKKLERILFLVLVLLSAELSSHDTYEPKPALRNLNQNAFKVGEFLKYRIHYGLINAGEAELRVKSITNRQDRPVFHIEGIGRSIGMAEVFFKTRDTYTTFVDTESIVPHEFIRDVNEGGFIIKRHLFFDQVNRTAIDKEVPKKVFEIPAFAQDMLSAFYYARSNDASKLKKGSSIPISIFLDHETFDFKLKYLGVETLKTKWGKIECLKFQPVVQSGRVFKEKEGITLWVSNDQNKIPVRMQAELAVGSIKMDLSDFKNTMVPIVFKK
jgi:hypothetical protein